MFMGGYEAGQFFREQDRAHCRISKVTSKSSGAVWFIPRPSRPLPDPLPRCTLTMGTRIDRDAMIEIQVIP
jgi:hypothetical protein